MTIRPPRLAAVTTALAALTTAALLGGCLKAGPGTNFYLLTPTIEQAAQGKRAAKPLVVVIKDVRLPLYLDRPQIVTRDDGNRLTVAEFEQWGGHLREDMARILATNLASVLEGDRIVLAPYHMPVPPDFRLEVEVLRFEREPGGRVGLSAQWWLTRGSDGALIATSDRTFTGEPLSGSGGDKAAYERLVNSMSAVYGDLARAIARSIRPREAGGA